MAMASAEAAAAAAANPYVGCFLSVVSKSEMRYAGILYRVDPHDAVIGLTNARSFGTEGRRKDGPQVLPDDRVFDYVNFRGSDIKELQVLSSESQPEKVTSDLPDDPAIIQAIFLHSSSASAITPQAATISKPNSSSFGLPTLAVDQTLSPYQPIQTLTSFSSLLSTNALAAGQPVLLHGQEFGRSMGEVPYPQQPLLAGLPPSLAAYHIKQPMQHPVTNLLTMSVAATYGLSDPLKPPVIMDSLTSTPTLIPSDLPLDPALLISDTLPNVAKDLLSSRMTSMSSAAKCSSTAGLNINPIPQVIHGANFVQGSGLVLESLPLVMSRKSGSLNHMEDSRPPLKTPSQNLQTGAQPLSSSHFSRSAHEDKEVVKSLTPELLLREPTGAQAPILPLPEPYARKIPHLAAKYAEDFDFVAMNQKFNKDEVWGELGNHSKAHLKIKADASDLPAEDAEDVDAAMKLDKKPGYVKDDFFDLLSTVQPGPWKPKISERRKLDVETFGYYQVHQRSHGSRSSRLEGNPKVYGDGRENSNAGRGRVRPTWSHVT
ncbi:hypothetical protein BT93_L5680 [Corymbia citriodora subsp. variegata]|uniref:DFDF domain-containing protein n=1 Tax=Corymbia citriodora subsp. variegata TaxID=360336 RepID=A0A8T0CVU1_CORYI|nr:hypothetical protein BT93_L5680 [Corymbia citriodora subsp. variegata]